VGKEKRFIKDYVNNVYAIILGFGFVEITKNIFSSETPLSFTFDNSNFFQASMAFFVIIVVCLNWWDWSDNIGDKVKSTFLEFIIDLFILFTLLIMFFRFDDPLALIKLFFALSVLDLVWVVNYLREHKKATEEPIPKPIIIPIIDKNFRITFLISSSIDCLKTEVQISNFEFWDRSEQKKENWKWISQKILALFLYGLAWYFCLKISSYLIIYNYSKGMPLYGFLVSIPILVAFILVRFLCFRHRILHDFG